MARVQINTRLIAEDQTISFHGKGIYDKKTNTLKFKDKDAKITILLKENILIRETEEVILSYKFMKEEPTRFEIFIKDLNKTGFLEMKTELLSKKESTFEVKYQLDGNQFTHHYFVEWRKL